MKRFWILLFAFWGIHFLGAYASDPRLEDDVADAVSRIQKLPHATPAEQETLYKELIALRDLNNQHFGGKNNDVLRVLAHNLPRVFVSNNKLEKRARFNWAATLVRQADLVLARGSTPSVGDRHYQMAYYIFTCLQKDFPQAQRNAAELIQSGKISNLAQRPREQIIREEEALFVQKNVESVLQCMMADQRARLREQFLERKNVLTQFVQLKEADIQCILDKAMKEFVAERRPILEQEVLADLRRGDTFTLDREQYKHTQAENRLLHYSFSGQTVDNLVSLARDVAFLVHTTPFLEGRDTILVPVGRTPHMLSQLMQIMGPDITGVPVLPLLASNLRFCEPTAEQLKGYKEYLDTLGFASFGADREIILLDAGETYSTLLYLGQLIERVYPPLLGHVQYISIPTRETRTTCLSRARILLLTAEDMEALFIKGKHGPGLPYYSIPSFEPRHWPNWRAYLKGFVVPSEALIVQRDMQNYVEQNRALLRRQFLRDS